MNQHNTPLCYKNEMEIDNVLYPQNSSVGKHDNLSRIDLSHRISIAIGKICHHIPSAFSFSFLNPNISYPCNHPHWADTNPWTDILRLDMSIRLFARIFSYTFSKKHTVRSAENEILPAYWGCALSPIFMAY